MVDLPELVARRNVDRLNQRARDLLGQDSVDEALGLAAHGAEIAQASLSFDCAESVAILNTLAAINMRLHRYDVAEAILRELVTGAAQSKQAETGEYAIALNNLALACTRQNRDADAIPFMEQAIKLKRKNHGGDYADLLGNLHDIAHMLAAEDRDADASPYFKEVCELVRGRTGRESLEYAQALQNYALALRLAGREQEAVSAAQDAASILNVQGSYVARGGEVEQDLKLVDAKVVERVLDLYDRGEPDKAVDIQRKVIATLPQIPLLHMVTRALGHPLDPFLRQIEILDKQGYDAERRGDLATAGAKYEQVARMTAASLGMDHPKNVEPLNNLAEVERKKGKFSDAKRTYSRALELVRGGDEDREPKRTVLANLAGLFLNIADNIAPYPPEPEFFDSLSVERPDDFTVSVRVRVPQPIEGESPVSNAMRWLDARAKFYESIGSFERTKSLYELCLELCLLARGEHHSALLDPLQELASFEMERGLFVEAQVHIDKAIEIAELRPSEGILLLVKLLQLRAMLMSRVGQRGASKAAMLRAIEIGRGQLAEDILEELEENLAVVHLQAGETEPAIPILRRILDRVSADNFDSVDPRRLQQLASYAAVVGSHELALEYYEASIEGQRLKSGEWTTAFARTLSNYATQLRTMGRWDEAEANYHRALQIRRELLGSDHPSVVETLVRLALVLQARDEPDEAFAAAENVLDIGTRVAGRLSAMSSDAARLDIVREQLSHLGIALSIVHASLGGKPMMVARAFELVLRRKAIAGQALVVQRNAVLGGRYPYLEPKLRALDELRIQIIRSSMQTPQEGAVDKHDLVLAEAIRHRQELEAELAGEVAEMRLEIPLSQSSVAAVANALPSGSALVEFVKLAPYNFKGIEQDGDPSYLPARYLAFVLPAERPEALTLVDVGQCDDIDKLIQRVASRTPPASRHIGTVTAHEASAGSAGPDTELMHRIFACVTCHTKNAKRLFIAPDGDLFLVAFDTLPLDDGRLVIDEYEISFLGAGRDAMRFSLAPSASLTSPVIIAAPDFDLSMAQDASPVPEVGEQANERGWLEKLSGRLDPLPGALSEGIELSRQLPNALLLSGKQALESTIRQLKRPVILHFATHGFAIQAEEHTGKLTDDAMLRAGIALAGANTWIQKLPLPHEAEDGIMTAEDIATLDLIDTELVVLSACETGIGEILSGEGVFGLRRAFMVAGARSVVMSLWRVPDNDTRELMMLFYQQLLKGESKPAALRAAKLALREQGRSHQSWGAFICEGDWNPLRLPQAMARA